MNPIEVVVAPLKADAMERAEQEARQVIARIRDELDAAGWNIAKAAPHGDYMKMSHHDYQRANTKRHTFAVVTSHIQSYKLEDRDIVRMSLDKCEAYIKMRVEGAAAQYDLFVMKLTNKIGACSGATLEGNHVWGSSILTVTKGDIVERWHTQQIVNCSVNGLYFNQWPSRLMKPKKQRVKKERTSRTRRGPNELNYEKTQMGNGEWYVFRIETDGTKTDMGQSFKTSADARRWIRNER